MKSFTGIIFWSILMICSACTDENETSEGESTDRYKGFPLTVRATTTDFEHSPLSGKLSTRVSVKDEHLKTQFADGDSIGIFAVKDDAIVDDIDNIPLVYNMANDSWNPVENGKTLYWYDKVSYVAYYPYKKNITIDTSKGTDGTIASLLKNEKLQPAKDQSTAEKHTASDLMIAIGMVITCDPKKMEGEECYKKGWNHAYVMGLDNIGIGVWSQDTFALQTGIPPLTINDKIEDNMNGYAETEQMLKDADLSNKHSVFTKLMDYRTKTEKSDGLRSPWFIPSIGQWFDVLVNICEEYPRNFQNNTSNSLNDLQLGKKTLNKLKEQLSKVNNSLPEFTPTGHRLGFSSSSQYNEKRCWMLLWHIDDTDPKYADWDRICIQGYYKTAEWNIRAFFAF